MTLFRFRPVTPSSNLSHKTSTNTLLLAVADPLLFSVAHDHPHIRYHRLHSISLGCFPRCPFSFFCQRQFVAQSHPGPVPRSPYQPCLLATAEDNPACKLSANHRPEISTKLKHSIGKTDAVEDGRRIPGEQLPPGLCVLQLGRRPRQLRADHKRRGRRLKSVTLAGLMV